MSIAPKDIKHNASYEIGLKGEELVKKHYEKQGFTCLKSRYKTRFGEVDLIFLKGDLLLFVEVKTRDKFNANYDIISPKQVIRNCKAAQMFLSNNDHLINHNMQFNLVIVIDNRIADIYESAWDDVS